MLTSSVVSITPWIDQRGTTYDYAGYGQGLYYPPPPPGSSAPGLMYNMYEHSPSGAPPTPSSLAPRSHGGVPLPPHPPTPGAGPAWYAPAPVTCGGGSNMARRPGLLEVSAVVPTHHGTGPQNRGPEGSTASRPGDHRGPARKTN
ncbi:hypothetical protein EC991_004247 [Linnemannia zychae]|nr:hypothetical protein EC991_004247 [Linnemannia zychae]